MAEAEAKEEVHASGLEAGNKVSENTSAEVAASEVVKLDVEVPKIISEGEEMREANQKEENDSLMKSSNAEPAVTALVNTEPAESGRVNMEIEVPVSVSVPEGKKEENKSVAKKSGKKLIKRKAKKVTNPGNKASKIIATAETAAAEPVKLNAEVPAATAGGEDKNEEGKKEETKEKQITTPGELSKKRKRKKVTKPVNMASVEITAVGTAAPEVSTAIPGGGGKSKEDKKEETKEVQNKEEKEDGALTTPGENSKKRRRKRNKTVIVSDKPETSAKGTDEKKSASMGMIFMCSSKTKQDCYRYKVFGLPAGKKDAVAKIYKGMRLFLFDIDLKLLYGIYKAAGPGGYNLEPKAFKSAFPSQVRFSIMEDCLPLAEEKFKVAIKDNYYGKNKFNCQLNADQVKNLCKLFKKGRQSKQVGRDHKSEPYSVVDRSGEKQHVQDKERRRGKDRERRQGQDGERRQGQDGERHQRQDRERRHGRDREKRQGRDKDRRQGRDRVRPPPVSGRDYRVLQPDGLYEREVFAPAVHPTMHLPQHLLLPTTYTLPSSDVDSYRRDPLVERRMLELELNRREDVAAAYRREGAAVAYREPLVYSRDPPAREPHLSYHEQVYSRVPPVEEPSYPYHDGLYTRVLPPAQEQPLSYHESAYARATQSYPLSSLYRQ